MSQFLLCKSKNKIVDYNGKRIDDYQYSNQLIQSVIKEYYNIDDLNNLWIIEEIHNYCDEAQQHGEFQDTTLYNLLSELYDQCDDMIFWYGSDYKDLEIIQSKYDLLNNVNLCLKDTCCEIYLRVIKQ